MTVVLQDTEALKLHTAGDGTVWFADGRRVPIASGIPVDEFVESLTKRGGRLNVRLVGSRANAQLIVALHRRCKAAGSLEVASPLVCGGLYAAPEKVLYLMRQCNLPSSLGGWHPVTDLDYPAYAMIRQLQLDGRVTDHVLAHLKGHPAWHDLKLIPNIDPKWVAYTLAFVTDPRWYIDPEHPDRCSKLQAYLGLTPKIMARVFHGERVSGATSRCAAALCCWHEGGTPKNSESMQLPGNFLWRIFGGSPDVVRGMLRTTQRFVVYLRHTWLQALYGRTELFLPEMYFKRADEVEAYKAHATTRSRSV